jgi:hypothetical protein
MPIVTIKVTREGSGPGRDSVTPEEKAALIGSSGPASYWQPGMACLGFAICVPGERIEGRRSRTPPASPER